jgi:hypothetical protein
VTAEVSALTVPFFRQSAMFSTLWRRHIVDELGNGKCPHGRKVLEWESAPGGLDLLARPAGSARTDGTGRWT